MTNKVAIILGSENDKKYVEDSYKYFDYFLLKLRRMLFLRIGIQIKLLNLQKMLEQMIIKY